METKTKFIDSEVVFDKAQRPSLQMLNLSKIPDIEDDLKLSGIHPIQSKRMVPKAVSMHFKDSYNFVDRDISKGKMHKILKDPTLKHGGVPPFALGSERFQYPEYNFSNIVTIIETESIVARAFGRKEVLCLKEGWDFVGKNPKTVQYIKKRFAEIAHVSGIRTEELIRHIATDLISFSNAFFAVKRDENFSSGMNRTVDKKELKPIAGLFPIAPETVLIRFDKKGNITAISQEIKYSSKRQVYPKRNFYHFKLHNRTGFSVGTPVLTAVEEDIGALRRIEENVEILLYQYLFPLYSYQVGTETAPARQFADGTTEIDAVRDMWAALPPEGAVVIPERHKLEMISNKNAAVDALPYLNHFKQRVLGGVEVSSLDMGDGATSNRSTSENLSKILVDAVKFIQRRIEWQMQELINELLLESSFPDEEVLSEDHSVHIKFKEIDIDALIKKQNHAEQMFTGHGINQPEFRRELGLEPFTEEEWKESYYSKIQEPQALIAAKQDGFSAEAEALAEHPSSSITRQNVNKEQQAIKAREKEQAKAKAQSPQVSQKASSGTRAAASANRPSNQHGRKTGSETRKTTEASSVMTFKDMFQSPVELSNSGYFLDQWNTLKQDINFLTINDKKTLMNLVSINIFNSKKMLVEDIYVKIYEGIRDAMDEMGEAHKSFGVSVPVIFQKEIELHIETLLDAFIKDVDLKLNKWDRKHPTYKNLSVLDVLGTFTHRVKYIQGNETNRGYNLGRALGLRFLGVNDAAITSVSKDACSECKKITKINLHEIDYKSIPPIAHPNAKQIIVAANKSLEDN